MGNVVHVDILLELDPEDEAGHEFAPACRALKIVYVGGAIVRSDLEINDQSTNIGAIPCSWHRYNF